jgi:spermidine dehydrogenase
VVGGGISGSLRPFYRARTGRFGARILILDNHDDFGLRKRNEFALGGKIQPFVNGGTLHRQPAPL